MACTLITTEPPFLRQWTAPCATYEENPQRNARIPADERHLTQPSHNQIALPSRGHGGHLINKRAGGMQGADCIESNHYNDQGLN